MSAQQKPEPGHAVATVEPAAVPYALRSRAGELLRSEEARAQILPLIPHGVDYDHVILEVHRASVQNPDILQCSPESIIIAVGTAVQTGLVIGRTIHLVPVSKKLQAWTDYKGDIELVLASGAARLIDAQVVYERDVFEYALGDSPYVKHRPAPATGRGAIVYAYAIAWINGTGTLKKITVMPIADIEAIRAKSRGWNPEKVRTCPDWYAQKTAIHRVTKTLPRTPRLSKVLALFQHQDEIDREELDPANRIDTPATPALATAAEWEPSAPAPRPPSQAASFLLPFGKTLKGRPLGELTDQQLLDGYRWAQEQNDPALAAFITAAEELLEERRATKDGAA